MRPLASALIATAWAATAMAAPPAGDIATQRKALAAINAEEDALDAAMGSNRQAIARLLSALELFSRDPPPALVVGAGDVKNAVRAMVLSRAILPDLRARAQALEQQAAALAQVRRRAALASGDLFAAESAMADRQGRLAAVTADAALFSSPAARRDLTAEAAAPAPASLIAPVGGTATAGFGGRLADGQASEGIAYRTGAGAAVHAPAAGVVDFAGPLNGWGQVVILRAGGDCHMVLSGLGKVTVTVGQQVAAAFPLGTMPAPGHGAPELYFEVRLNGAPVDPARLMGPHRTSGRGLQEAGAVDDAAGSSPVREGVH